MKRIFEIFEEILSIPRSSGNENQIANYLMDFAKNHNLESNKDKFNNVLIKKNNHSDKTIILQAHSDMVCVSDIEYDFDNKGIDFYIDDDYYKARHTSLGADDGIGIAIILAMLEETENMPNIEAMITTQEETTMLGAMNFNYDLLSANTLISLDGIKEADIESSSAGMCSLTISKKIKFETSEDSFYKLTISGLAGGHSGDDINKHRCNAIKLLSMILCKLNYTNLSDIRIGEKDNVIPSEGYVIFSSTQDLKELKDNLNNLNFNLSKSDSNLKIDIDKYINNIKIKNSNEIIDFINELEDGLLETFIDDDFPLLSSNIGKISLENNELIIKMSLRSADIYKEEKQLNKLKSLCTKYHFTLNIDAQKPFFPFRENSKIRLLLSDTYKELYQKDTITKKIHACMEGGIICNNIDNLDICTIAPTIDDCHTIKEKVSISSTKRVYNWLKLCLQKYNN